MYNLLFTTFPICYIALWDKDVTYEYVMNDEEEEEHYRSNEFTGLSLDQSYVPTTNLKTKYLIKKYFHHLYYTTQRGWTFNWKTFLGEVVNAVVISVVLCLFGYLIFAGDRAITIDGQTSDFWIASFSIYASLVYTTNVVILTRAGQITWLLIVYCTFISVIPFWLLSFIFDTYMDLPDARQRILENMAVSSQYYLFFILTMSVGFIIEVFKRFYKMFHKPTLSEYFLWLIKNKKEDQEQYFTQEIFDSFIKLHDPIKRKPSRKLSHKESSEFTVLNGEKEEGTKERHMVDSDDRSHNKLQDQDIGSPVNMQRSASTHNPQQPEKQTKNSLHSSEQDLLPAAEEEDKPGVNQLNKAQILHSEQPPLFSHEPQTVSQAHSTSQLVLSKPKPSLPSLQIPKIIPPRPDSPVSHSSDGRHLPVLSEGI